MSFTGFSEEDVQRMKFAETGAKSGTYMSNPNMRMIDKLGVKTKRTFQHNKSSMNQTQNLDDLIDNIEFDKCKLSLKSPTIPPTVGIVDLVNNDNNTEPTNGITNGTDDLEPKAVDSNEETAVNTDTTDTSELEEPSHADRRNSVVTPDVVRHLGNYTEDELAAHRVKLEELQLKQKLMEEQNKKRKEMLSKALADRTKQTEEEVQKLEKIKKELQILDGQFSLDVGVLRKKIDQACVSYSEAEKHYLKVEKEFLQAKINLQKEKEKKELLTEHLCALITHNETRKAQKLETLMLELATAKNNSVNEIGTSVDKSVIIDGVDGGSGKMVELTPDS